MSVRVIGGHLPATRPENTVAIRLAPRPAPIRGNGNGD